MEDYVKALKMPFTDIGKLAMYILLSIVPVINFAAWGYLLDVAQTSMKKKTKLPKFKSFWKLFVEGLKCLLITVVYLIPLIIAVILLVFSAPFLSVSSTVALVILILLITLPFATLGILRYAEKRKTKEAFNIKQILKKMNMKFFPGWLMSLLIASVIQFVLSKIPIIGIPFGAGVSGIFYMSAMGSVYSKC
ncbi:MAG: DUF4013 domain-containing protein [Nanoarchaeota archaeon]|nr:DUF4013 domain-containing protein [Nanoarchaeota archaeon]